MRSSNNMKQQTNILSQLFRSSLFAISIGLLGGCGNLQNETVQSNNQIRTMAYPSQGSQVTVYQRGNYDVPEASRSVGVGKYRLTTETWGVGGYQNNNISGITVPDGLRATLCDNNQFPYGRCRVFEAGNYPFVGDAMNDITGFIQVSSSPARVSIYSDRDFLGVYSSYIENEFSGLSVGVWTPSNNGPVYYWDNTISSLQIPPGLRVRACENSDGSGACQTFEAGDHIYVGDALNDRISRLEITSVPVKNLVMVYEDAGYLGRAQAFGAGTFSAANGGYSYSYYGLGQLAIIGNDRLSSLRVPVGLTAKICDNGDGSGSCSIYPAGDYTSVGSMNDRTSYIQVY
jgi:hypothetical protein